MKEQKIKTPTKFITDIKEATKLAKKSIEEANTRNADNLNSNRRDDQFELGDEVFLSTANLALKPGRNKTLSPKFIGPLKVLEKKANGLAYELQMPTELGAVHDTFHISLQTSLNGTPSPKRKIQVETT